MYIKTGIVSDGNSEVITDLMEHGNICINTENCRFPVVISFRADELHNLLMKLLSNPEMTKVAVFPPGVSKEAKKEFLDSVPVPETPEATKSAMKFLRKAAINKLVNNAESFDVEAGDSSVVVELGSVLDEHKSNTTKSYKKKWKNNKKIINAEICICRENKCSKKIACKGDCGCNKCLQDYSDFLSFE